MYNKWQEVVKKLIKEFQEHVYQIMLLIKGCMQE